ncbi:MAG: AAA family ATPase [Bdellovibrionaceae bacterium]|nr:AAA family ATPase [Pseudobdellovibrionaceae bacterium]
MLKVKKLILNDFGPYKGRQEVTFPDSPGVVVFFGENGRGKTSLLNAIRFVLFDRIIGRGSKSVDYKNILNWESDKEGKTQFSVELVFLFGGEEYHLTRLCNLSPSTPQKTETFLRKQGVNLSTDIAQKMISKMMPEQVSRFFLFDGELLQEYEDLLLESTQSIGIKEAIERILGVPILTNTLSHLTEASREAKKTEARSLENVSKTKHIGEALKQLQEFEAAFELDKRMCEKNLTDARGEKLAAESVMRENEKAGEVIGRKSVLSDEIKTLENDIVRLESDLSGQSKNIWLLPIKTKIQELLNNLINEQDKKMQQYANHVTMLLARKSSEEGQCALCESNLSADVRSKLSTRATSFGEAHSFTEMNSFGGRIQKLQDLSNRTDSSLIQHLLNEIKSKKNRVYERRMEISDIEKQLIGIDEKEISLSKARFERAIKEISKLEITLQKITADLEKKKAEIQELQKSLSKITEKKGSKDTLRRTYYDQLMEIFSSGLSTYRDRLKHHVEKEASLLFKEFTSDTDYDRLKINQNYGLTIVHRDDSEIPVRSAGFEHIVALSLMGSLQKNAPLQGPIFMDSPMGRLDRVHKVNVTKGLPNMSEQVALLVYEEEISQKMWRPCWVRSY